MSPHLTDEAFADVLFGHAGQPVREHLRGCPSCAARLAEAEEGLVLARHDEVPEPSPLYWEAFRRNVGRRIEGEPRRVSRLAWLVPIAAAAGIAAVVLVRGPVRPVSPLSSPSAAVALPAWSALPPLEDDEAVPVLEGVVASVGPAEWDEGRGVDAYVAGLSEDESRALADALARQAGKEDL
jgi:hypothetical protein